MPEPSANKAVPAVSDFAETQALIQQITAEARSSGQSMTFDPEAPSEDATPRPAKPAKAKAAEAPQDELTEDGDGSTETSHEENPEAQESSEDTEQDEEPAQTAGEIDVDALRAALAAEGGVDMLALSRALGKELEELGLTPGAAKFLRLESKRATATMRRAEELAERLQRQYGDQGAARKAASEGQLEPAIKFIEDTFGMGWNELNKAVGLLLQGKPVPDLEKNRELRELRKREAEREAATKQAADEAAAAAKVESAKTWIRSQIKSDKLASPEFEQQLRDAGFPPVADLVFEEMQANYSRGMTDPRKALEVVRARFIKQAKALRSVGLAPKAAPPKAPVSRTSRPRTDAQTGAAGNSRPMTDLELRQAVLREAGLLR